jgi:chromosome segregation ATPase
MSDSAATTRIVPDVDQSFNAQHLRYRKGPSLWPLWVVLLVLIAVLSAAAAGLWFERERLLSELNRVSGEVSNMHARLDAGDNDVQERLISVQDQVSTLFQEQEQLSIALTNAREELFSLIPASEEMVSAEAIEALLQQVEQQQEAAQLRDSQLAAMNASLNALEQSSDNAQARLAEEVERLPEQSNAREETLDDLGQSLDAVEQAWQQRLASLEGDLRQVRQSQLALSAQLEMLR